ncbi:hypothetical protein [Candidatus Lokiarchaeum ossiferum]|uniref:hypothetical protein n=1 Tax=Candidatus Lokiarchaeum ossiferum TaxID=2951803 RepID=UPI00352E9B11
MGVKLKSLIISERKEIDDIKGSKIAVDGMNVLFQILYNPIQMQKKLPDTFYLDSTRRVITHLYGWMQKIKYFYKHQILPIVVFDGKPDPFKRLSTKDYARDFLAVEKMYKDCIDKGEKELAKRHALSRSYMFMNCVHESKILLEACGIPVLMAPSEAEAQCVSLQQQGLVDYVLSNDYDVLLFGATKVIRKLTFQSRKKIKGKWTIYKPEIEILDGPANLKRLGINLHQLIDLSILLGNDYFSGIAGIGSKKALESLEYYGSIEKMLLSHPNRFSGLSINKLHKIRNLFLNPENIKISELSFKTFNESKLHELLLKDHSLNPEKVKRNIVSLHALHDKVCKKKNLSHPQSAQKVFPPFNKHLQRRLDRAKKKRNLPDLPSLSFTSADHL